MAQLTWDQQGERRYETGVDHGVLYIPNAQGVYDAGFAWNGLTTVTEQPSGAEPSPIYADNIKYLNLISAEEFAATIEAYTYPDEFAICDGTAEPASGIFVGQQTRKAFGLSFRTRIGNDLTPEAGYKIHLIYNAMAAPTEKAYATVNDSPEAIAFSWSLSTTPVDVPNLKPTASITIDSTKVAPAQLAALETILYGTQAAAPRLPLPAEVISTVGAASITEVTTVAPTFTLSTKTIAIPAVAGVTYLIDGKPVTGSVVIAKDTVVTAVPKTGYKFSPVSDDDWSFDLP